MPKKPFSETKIGKFVEKCKPVLGDVLQIAGDITGVEVLEKVGAALDGKRAEDAQAQALWVELEEKRMEMELELARLEMEAMRIDLEGFKIETDDRQNARSREIEFMKASGGKRDWVQGGLTITFVVLLATVLVLLWFKEIPKENQRIFDMLLGGTVVYGVTSIIQYNFGSSRGSRQKDEMITKAMQR